MMGPKPGLQTTEFWVSIAACLVGIATTVGWFTPDQASTTVQGIAQVAGILGTVGAAFGYSISRGNAKKGNQ